MYGHMNVKMLDVVMVIAYADILRSRSYYLLL